jgi:hypothetical protein
MANFEVQLNADVDLTSATVSALSGRRVRILEEDGAVHPFRSLAASCSRFAQALEEFLNVLDSAEAKGIDPRDTKAPVPGSFEVLCYRAAEVFEVYEKLPGAIELLDSKKYKQEVRRYKEAIKSASRDWNLLCNAMKHASNSIAYTQYRFVGFVPVVSGFSLCAPKRGAMLDINKNFHQGSERVRAFNTELQHLIYSLIRCDVVAGDVIRALPEQECGELPLNSLNLNIGKSLVRIAHRPDVALPNQKSMFDGITLAPPKLVLRRKQAKFIRSRYEARSSYSGDGFTQIFPII